MNIKNYCLKKTFLFFCVVSYYGVVGEKIVQNNLKDKDLNKISTPEIKENTDNKVLPKESVSILNLLTNEKFSIPKMLQATQFKDVCIMKDPDIKTNYWKIFLTRILPGYLHVIRLFANDKEKNFSQFDKDALYNALILFTTLMISRYIIPFDPSLEQEIEEFLDLVISQIGSSEENLEQEKQEKGAALFDKIFSNPNFVMKVHGKKVDVQKLKNTALYPLLISLIEQYYLANFAVFLCTKYVNKSHEDIMKQKEKAQKEDEKNSKR